MKNLKYVFLACMVPAMSLTSQAGVTATAPATESSDSGNWYWSTLAGYNHASNLEVFYPTLFGIFGPDAGYQNLDMDHGYAAGLAFGYEMAEGETGQWSFELEAMFAENSFKGDSTFGFARAREVEGDLQQINLMLNARRTFTYWDKFTPYAGIGLGASHSNLDITQRGYNSGTLINTISADDEQIVLMYQAILGVEVPLKDSWTFFTEYRFSMTDGSEFVVGNGPAGNTTVGDELINHSLLLGLKCNF